MSKKIKNNKLVMSLVIAIELLLIGIFALAISVCKFTNGYQNFISSKDGSIFWLGFFLIVVMVISTIMIISSSFSSLITFKKIQDGKKNK